MTEECPVTGWAVLVEASPSPTDNISNRNALEVPEWRPWGPNKVPDVTLGEMQTFCEDMFRLLLKKVGNVTHRWVDLLGLWPQLPSGPRQEVSELLVSQVDELRKNPNSIELWTAVRRKLHFHRSYPNSNWSFNSHEVILLETVYVELVPEDLIGAHSWLFESSPCLPDVSSVDENEHEKQIISAQQKAIRTISACGGRTALLGLIRVAESPGSVGRAVARELDSNEVLRLALKCIKTNDSRGKEFARCFLGQCFQQSDWSILDAALDGVKNSGNSNPQAVATIYFAASGKDMASCMQRLQFEDDLAQEAYWSKVDERHIMWANLNEQDFSRAVNCLLDAGRSLSVATLLNCKPTSSGFIVRVLEQIPIDRSRNTEPEPTPRVLSSYRINQLFEQLDAADDVSNEVIARLEIPYIHELRKDRPNFVLYKKIVRVPSLFAELICSVFGRSDGQKEEVILDVQQRELIATLSLGILAANRELPGLKGDGTFDVEELCQWVAEARRLCDERGAGKLENDILGVC